MHAFRALAFTPALLVAFLVVLAVTVQAEPVPGGYKSHGPTKTKTPPPKPTPTCPAGKLLCCAVEFLGVFYDCEKVDPKYKYDCNWELVCCDKVEGYVNGDLEGYKCKSEKI